GHPLSVEHNEVAQGSGVSAIPFDASSVRPKVLTPCVRDEVHVQLDGSSGGRRFNELKRNVADHDGGQANKTCVRPLYSSSCVVQQLSAALGVSPIAPSVGHLDCVSSIGPSVGRSKRNASSQDDGDNVFHIGPSVPLKRPCVRQLSPLSERVVLNTHLTSQSPNPVNVNTSSVPTEEHHDDAHHGVHIGFGEGWGNWCCIMKTKRNLVPKCVNTNHNTEKKNTNGVGGGTSDVSTDLSMNTVVPVVGSTALRSTTVKRTLVPRVQQVSSAVEEACKKDGDDVLGSSMEVKQIRFYKRLAYEIAQVLVHDYAMIKNGISIHIANIMNEVIIMF
nr:hypothetical protein [Tanacetum cinerariifolium]